MENRNIRSERVAWRLRELAEAYGISVSLLRKEIRAGRLPARRAGAAVLVLDREFHEYLERRSKTENGASEDAGFVDSRTRRA